jgi:hypothetical protein
MSVNSDKNGSEGEHIMDAETSNPIEEKEQQKQQDVQKPEWYTFLIDIFKKLLEFNYSSYGTKKEF